MEISNEVLASKMDNLQATLNEMKISIDKVDDKQRQSQLEAVRDHARIENKADAAHKRIDALSTQSSRFEKDIPSLIIAYRIMVFIGGALGLSVISLIWSLLTGQTKIAFAP